MRRFLELRAIHFANYSYAVVVPQTTEALCMQ